MSAKKAVWYQKSQHRYIRRVFWIKLYMPNHAKESTHDIMGSKHHATHVKDTDNTVDWYAEIQHSNWSDWPKNSRMDAKLIT